MTVFGPCDSDSMWRSSACHGTNWYAVRSSQRVRLGIATGNGKTNFNIPSILMSGLTALHFVADPIGGRRASVSQEITVAPGDTVVLTIPLA